MQIKGVNISNYNWLQFDPQLNSFWNWSWCWWARSRWFLLL